MQITYSVKQLWHHFDPAAKFHAVRSVFDHLSLYVFTVALGACLVHKLPCSMHSGSWDDSSLPRFCLVMIKYELSPQFRFLLVGAVGVRGGGQMIIKSLGAVIWEMPPSLIAPSPSEIQSVSLERYRGTRWTDYIENLVLECKQCKEQSVPYLFMAVETGADPDNAIHDTPSPDQ